MDDRSTHAVWRSGEWQPCWCAAKIDHPIGREVVPLGRFINVGNGHQVRVAAAPDPKENNRE